jgi:WD40 repeat protein/serine/threonine protein kinase
MVTDIQDLTGQTIKGYELRERIGRGGFGAVYRAYQSSVDREVAVKVILPEHANNPDFIRRFESEAQVIARLEHLHITPLYDYWREPDRALLVMRLLKGGSLQDSIERQGAWGLNETARLLDQIADALNTAHRQQIIHRDLKPANILLDENNNAYLADFGIAKKLTAEPQLPTEEDRYGSPAFISPEQVTGQAVSPQTDIYSLGMVLYVMLTGHTPFFDTHTSTVIRKQLNEPLPPLQTFRADLPYTINVIIWRATSKRPEARYPDALNLAVDFRQAIAPDSVRGMVASQLSNPGVLPPLKTPPGGQTVILQPLPLLKNPYKGLRAFQEADAADFFGRTGLVDRLIARLADPDNPTAFLAVVGPSGSGKSSVVRAGLIPALKRGALFGSKDWFYAQMTPGANPIQELADALLSVALDAPASLTDLFKLSESALANLIPRILPDPKAELILVIDQFEELFTLGATEQERVHFLQLLSKAVTAPTSHFRVIITLRADFYDRPLYYPGFSTLMRDCSEIVLPLTSGELEQAIVSPAARLGIQFEPGLVLKMVADVNQQPGALPLLQFALTELFERRDNHLLTYRAYHDSGGVLSALAHRADELYETLDSISQGAARQLFLRLVSIGEGGDDTRRRALRSELNYIATDKAVVEKVIDSFGKHRLLTFDYEPSSRTPTVEIAHEALIQVWERLRQWLDTSRDDLRLYRRLSTASAEWVNAKRDPSFLASGSRLAQFELLERSALLQLATEETDYLDASIKARQRAVTRVRNVITGLAALSIFAVALALLAFYLQRVADQQASISRSRELAITALTTVGRLDLSLLLSLEALNAADTFEARNSLLTALQSRPRLLHFLEAHSEAVRAVTYSPDGRLLASGGRDNAIIIWDTQTNRPIMPPLQGHTDWVNSLAFSPDNRMLISVSADGTARRWDTVSGQLIGQPLKTDAENVWSIAFNPNTRSFATGGLDGIIQIWDADSGEPIGTPLKGHTDIVYGLAYSPDGRLLASGSGDSTVRLWDTKDYHQIGEPLQDDNDFVLNVTFSPDGKRLASTGLNGIVDFWDPAASEFLYSIATGHTSRIKGLAFSPDGRLLATGSDDSTIRLWDTTTREQIDQPLTGHVDAVWSVAFSQDSRTLASASSDRKIILWDTISAQPLVRDTLTQSDDILTVAYSPDGKLYASAGGLKNGEDISIHIWDAQTNEEVLKLSGHNSYVTGLSFSPDSTQIVSVSPDQTLRLWDIKTGSNLFTKSLDDLNSFVPVTFSPDGGLIASGNADGSITLWNPQSGEKLGSALNGHSGSIRALAFSPDSKLLASGGVDRLLIIYDLETRMPVAPPLADYTDEILALAFSPDARVIASGGTDQKVTLWDAVTGRPLGQPWPAHEDWVTGLAFTPDGGILAASSQDGTISLLDLLEKQPLGKLLTAHTDFVNAVAFNREGSILISGGEDQKLILWDMSLSSWREQACSIANRNLAPQEWETYFGNLPYRLTCPLQSPT